MKMINISTKTAFIINAITSFVLSVLFSIYLSMQIIQVDAFEEMGFFRTAIFVFPACFIGFFIVISIFIFVCKWQSNKKIK